jgi:hypothetical protein
VGTSTITAIVVGDRVVGPALPREVQLGCLRLARLSQTPLLGIELTNGGSTNDWSFAGATPMPDLRMGGEPLLDALFAELYQPGESKTP